MSNVPIFKLPTIKFEKDKDRKQFAADLKKIYHAPNANRAEEIPRCC